jgi:hypothetical protein
LHLAQAFLGEHFEQEPGGTATALAKIRAEYSSYNIRSGALLTQQGLRPLERLPLESATTNRPVEPATIGDDHSGTYLARYGTAALSE